MADMVPIVAMGEMTNRPAVATEDGYDAEKLRLCLDSAIEEAAATHAGKPAAEGLGRRTTSQGQHGSDWRTLLRQIRRERLEEGLRNVHDELLIDALLAAGAPEELQASLARIPAEEAGPRVWQALEQSRIRPACATGQRPDERDIRRRAADLGRSNGAVMAQGLAIPGPAHRASCGDDRNRPWPTTGAMARAIAEDLRTARGARRKISARPNNRG